MKDLVDSGNVANEKDIIPQRELKFSDVLKILYENIFVLLISALVVSAVVFGITKFLVTPKYESFTTLYVVNNPQNGVTIGTVNNNDLLAAESLAETYSLIIQSNAVYDSVLNEVNSDEKGYKLTRDELTKYVDVSVLNETQLLKVNVTAADKYEAYRIASAFAKVAPKEIIRIAKAGSVEVVDTAEVGKNPVSPNIVLSCVYAFAAGLLVSAAFIIFKSLSNSVIYVAEDIEKIAGVTILGVVPEDNTDEGKIDEWKINKEENLGI